MKLLFQVSTDELPSHKHDSTIEDLLSSNTGVYKDTWYKATHWSDNYRFVDNNIKPTGSNQPHNNIPPSTAAYCWKRTA